MRKPLEVAVASGKVLNVKPTPRMLEIQARIRALESNEHEALARFNTHSLSDVIYLLRILGMEP